MGVGGGRWSWAALPSDAARTRRIPRQVLASGAVRTPFAIVLVLALAACAASRDAQRPASTEPRAVPTPGGLALGHAGAHRRSSSYGVVVHREIGLGGARFVLAVARACHERPEPAPPRDVLLEVDADERRCRVRPYHGPVALSLRRADGRWWNDAIELATDDEGRMFARYADLDRALVRQGARLDEFTAFQVGQGGWAGTYDLVRLRGVQADLHAQWVQRGRGSPGLFAARHVEHPSAAIAQELAVEARLARQERDFAAVQRGELGAAAFLDRHVWSPLRHRVASLLLEQRTHARADDTPPDDAVIER